MVVEECLYTEREELFFSDWPLYTTINDPQQCVDGANTKYHYYEWSECLKTERRWTNNGNSEFNSASREH